ncbi:MAG: SLBB domain-containing protein [Vulcanimicrobiota bacterium]
MRKSFFTILQIVLLLCFCGSPSLAQEAGGGVPAAGNPVQVPELQGGSLVPLSPEDHVLRAGDQLVLHVASLPDLPSTYTVRVDGFFYHPLIGEVQATGRTLADLRKEVQGKLARELRKPDFRLGLVQVAQHSVAVLGEARNQGTFRVGVGGSVLDVIAAAGGLSAKADSDRAVLLRGEERIELSLKPEVGGGLTKVRSGDILYILPGAPVNVVGEVTAPGVYSLSRVSGSPYQAILAAGGAKEEASLKRVRLVRSSLPEPIILNLSPESTEPLPEEAQTLREGDILVVPARQAVILGAVSNPGAVPLRGDETLLDLLPSRVGKDSDIRQIMVVRSDDVQKNREENEEYNLEEYFKEGKADIAAVPIHDGDIVYVPEKGKSGLSFLKRGISIMTLINIARWLF